MLPMRCTAIGKDVSVFLSFMQAIVAMASSNKSPFFMGQGLALFWF